MLDVIPNLILTVVGQFTQLNLCRASGLTAEDTFIRVTRQAQSQDLDRVMTEVQKESD